MKLRYKSGIIVSGLLIAFLYGRCAKPKTSPPGQLPKDDTEQITVNPETHKLIITRPGQKSITETLPDRTSTFDVKQNGTVKVSSSQMGFEAHPFLGLGIGQGLRAYAGSDFWYIKKLDLGLAGVTPKLTKGTDFTDWRIGMFASYNFYSNTRITLGYDNEKTIHLLLSVRI